MIALTKLADNFQKLGYNMQVSLCEAVEFLADQMHILILTKTAKNYPSVDLFP